MRSNTILLTYLCVIISLCHYCGGFQVIRSSPMTHSSVYRVVSISSASYHRNHIFRNIGTRRILTNLQAKAISKSSSKNGSAVEEESVEEIVEETVINEAKVEEEVVEDNQVEEEPVLDSEVLDAVELELNSTAIHDTMNTTVVIDMQAQAIADLEATLQQEVHNLKAKVTMERVKEGKLRDKISESGKMGFYLLQAKVSDFQKQRHAEQKELVVSNKRSFVQLLLPVIDAFRSVQEEVKAETEREESMHKNFGSLLSNMLNILEKSGYKEFNAEIGSKLDKVRHRIVGVQPGDEDGIILEQKRPGVIYQGDVVIRPTLVVASERPKLEVTQSSDESSDSEEGDIHAAINDCDVNAAVDGVDMDVDAIEVDRSDADTSYDLTNKFN